MIKDLLVGKSAPEKAAIKSREIAKFNHVGTFVSQEYGVKVEILSLTEIPGGVEVLARAWKNGKPLGFGGNGFTEIERFRIYNPPILVPDSHGAVIRKQTDDIDGTVHIARFREDPVEAIRQALAHTIKVSGLLGGNIIKGSIGNTTSTFYPDAGDPGTNSVDGEVITSGKASWSAARDAANGDSAASTDIYYNSLASKITASDWRVYHLYFTYLTSAIGSDTVDSATASFYHTTDALVDADNSTIYLVSNTQASNTTLAVGDFQSAGSANLATAALDITGMTNAYQDMEISAGNLNQIITNGVTKLALRVQVDVDNTEPTGNNAASFAQADADGTTTDPKLVVVHTAAAGAFDALLLGGD